MTRLIWAVAIALVAVSAYGFVVNSLRLSEIEDRRTYIVVVTDAHADASYYWLTVEGCSADHTDNGIECNAGWYGRSDREWSTGKQTPVPFRDAPRGPLLRFEARVTDRKGRTKATSSFLTTRSAR